jgi:hypothetical protein
MNIPTDDLICGPANSADARAETFFATIRSAYGDAAKLTEGLWADTVAAGWGQVRERGLLTDEKELDAFVKTAVASDASARQQRRGKLYPFNRIAKAQLGGAEKLGPDVSRFAVLYTLAHQSGWGETELAAFMARNTKDRHGRNVGAYHGGAAQARAILNGPEARARQNKAEKQKLQQILKNHEPPAFGQISAESVGVEHLPVGARFTVTFDVVAGPSGSKAVAACYRSNAPTAEVERRIIEDDAQEWPEVRQSRSNRHDAYAEAETAAEHPSPTTTAGRSQPPKGQKRKLELAR